MSRDPYQGVRHALTIIPLIQARQGITIEALMDATGLDESEIRDELQNLVMLCGVPPYSPNNYVSLWIEERNVYIRFAEQFERPVRLVVPEALALLLALSRLDRREHPYRDAVRRLQAKIREALGPEAAVELEKAERAIRMGEQTGGGRIRQLRDAMAQCRELRITYWSAHRSALSERVIRPYGMTEFGGDWYVVAHDSTRDKAISFRVDRIRDAELLDSEYEIPDDFDIQSWRDASDFTAPPGRTAARVLFRGMGARFAREQLPRRVVKELPDGSLLARVTVRSEAWFISWLLPFGSDAEVIEPAELRETMSATCRRILEFYDESPPTA
jgi:proteasome accessory factor C